MTNKSVAGIVTKLIAKKRKNVRALQPIVLDMARGEFEHGDKRALLFGIYLCASHNIPLPPWLADAFVQTFRNAKALKYQSWDEAFGRPRPKGAKKARGFYKELEAPVWLKARELHAKDQPFDDEMFHKVSAELKIQGATAATAKRVYYSSDHKSLKSLVSEFESLRHIIGEAQAKEWISDQFEGHPHKDMVTELILKFSLTQRF